MVPLQDIKTRIAARVQVADAAAKVYTFMRNLSMEKDQALLVGTDGRLHAWFMRLENVQLTELVVDQDFVEEVDTLVLEGFYGVSDANKSQNLFEDAVRAVLQNVNADRRAASGTKFNGLVK